MACAPCLPCSFMQRFLLPMQSGLSSSLFFHLSLFPPSTASSSPLSPFGHGARANLAPVLDCTICGQFGTLDHCALHSHNLKRRGRLQSSSSSHVYHSLFILSPAVTYHLTMPCSPSHLFLAVPAEPWLHTSGK